MAGNLLKADKHVVLYDLVPECIDRLTQNYADNTDIATCPAEVAKACDTVITMLPSNPHVEDCYLHQEHGLLTQARKGTLFIDSSTVDPATSRKVALACEDRQCDMVDAPVCFIYRLSRLLALIKIFLRVIPSVSLSLCLSVSLARSHNFSISIHTCNDTALYIYIYIYRIHMFISPVYSGPTLHTQLSLSLSLLYVPTQHIPNNHKTLITLNNLRYLVGSAVQKMPPSLSWLAVKNSNKNL